MSKLTIVTATGYTKEEAFKSIGSELKVTFDATVAWKNAEKPEGDKLAAFAEDYVNAKVKGAEGIGFFITVEAGSPDTRERPYKEENVVTKGARKFKTIYEGVVGADEQGNGGTIVLSSETKEDAKEAAKAYVTANKVDVLGKVKKEVTEGQAEAFLIRYTPSVNTKLGSYIFFGYEK